MPLVKFTELLGQNHGVLTISKLITTDDKDELEKRNKIAFEMQRDLANEGLQALTEVNVVNDFKKGMYTVAASHGIAGLKTNTIVFGWSQVKEGKIQELQIINNLASSGKNIIVAHFNKVFTKSQNKRIDIWWRGKDSNGDLMLLLSYLIRLNSKWKKARINIFSIVDTEDERISLENHIYYSIKEARIDVRVNILIKEGNVLDLLLKKSKHADLVFSGLSRHMKDLPNIVKTIDKIVAGLKAVAFVRNNGMKDETPIIFGNQRIK